MRPDGPTIQYARIVMRGEIVLMRVAPSTYLDIKRRLEDLGPLYTRDFFMNHPREGLVLMFGEVGFVPEPSDPMPRGRSS